MHAPFKSLMIDLLAKAEQPVNRLADDDYLHGDIEWYQYPLSHGRAGFTSLKLHGGITLHRSKVQFDSSVRSPECIDYCRARIDFTEPVLQVHCSLGGRAVRRDTLVRRDFAIDEQNAYVCVSSYAEFITAVHTDAPVESLHLGVSLSALGELLGFDAASELCATVERAQGSTHDLGRSVLSPLRYCLEEDLPFSVRKLRAHARALEFLSGLAMYFLSRGKPVAARKGPINAQQIRQFIRQHYRECVTLEDLARAFGVSSRTIHNILVRETGMPAARMMREQRLALAHEMIQQTDIPLTELADRMGYSQLSNFSAAFKKMFGYAPNVLRQSEYAYRSPSLAQFKIPGISFDPKK
ncbi:helix-turn-helix transcriptional regulator [Orrella marina]|uniref:HTH araC/xylS-type domain-containing protein n=1 Tax=Orrella marina TaxID=2163011 RepID=A0A2R4XHY8_9BURK|nr:AraC family transcriptional regulator [Orrella marina]AWB33447.1 hypothetical protein DBV39_06700 [Orrella marina]